jgi:hypothetical protein
MAFHLRARLPLALPCNFVPAHQTGKDPQRLQDIVSSERPDALKITKRCIDRRFIDSAPGIAEIAQFFSMDIR